MNRINWMRSYLSVTQQAASGMLPAFPAYLIAAGKVLSQDYCCVNEGITQPIASKHKTSLQG
ncbi:hypothetical protein [uncultured Desulfosarcina sp.]|uniref:hypothetical protein n=1 Tax=uncultured Desulfosarcina sp. TaxID=218289 RepID=UPI0029C769DD|nr:hypothetical protein [uncultured Desulfosarcina sp.]